MCRRLEGKQERRAVWVVGRAGRGKKAKSRCSGDRTKLSWNRQGCLTEQQKSGLAVGQGLSFTQAVVVEASPQVMPGKRLLIPVRSPT